MQPGIISMIHPKLEASRPRKSRLSIPKIHQNRDVRNLHHRSAGSLRLTSNILWRCVLEYCGSEPEQAVQSTINQLPNAFTSAIYNTCIYACLYVCVISLLHKYSRHILRSEFCETTIHISEGFIFTSSFDYANLALWIYLSTRLTRSELASFC